MSTKDQTKVIPKYCLHFIKKCYLALMAQVDVEYMLTRPIMVAPLRVQLAGKMTQLRNGLEIFNKRYDDAICLFADVSCTVSLQSRHCGVHGSEIAAQYCKTALKMLHCGLCVPWVQVLVTGTVCCNNCAVVCGPSCWSAPNEFLQLVLYTWSSGA